VTLSYHNVLVKFFCVIENGFAIFVHMILNKMNDVTNELQRRPPSDDYRIAKTLGLETFIYAVSL